MLREPRDIRKLGVLTTSIVLGLWALADAQTFEMRRVPLATKDIIYEPFSHKIYASIPSSAGSIGNTITVIDPVTATFGTSVYIGSEPGKLAVSDDGQYLYVALNGTTPGAVRRLHIDSLTPGLEFSLGSVSDNLPGPPGPLYVEDMEVLPGFPDSIAISRRVLGPSVGGKGVGIYDNGVMRPDLGRGNAIEFSMSAGVLYGYSNELCCPFPFWTMKVDESGLSIVSESDRLLSDFLLDIKYARGLIFSTSGYVIDPEKESVLGRFPIASTGLVRPDPASGLVYFLTHTYSPSVTKLDAYNVGNLKLAWSLELGEIDGTVASLIQWEEGIAFRTSDEVIIVRSSLFPIMSGANLSLKLTAPYDPVPPGAPMPFEFTVENLGPITATGVTLTETLPDDVGIVSVSSSQGTCDRANPIVCDLGSLNKGSAAVAKIQLIPSAPGGFTHIARVSANEPDHDLTNNVTGQLFPIDYFPALPGTRWTYVQNNSNTVTTEVLKRAVKVNGIETAVFDTSEDGTEEFYTTDSNGLQLHRLFQPDVSIEGLGKVDFSLTFIPPVKLSDAFAEVGQSFHSSGNAPTNRLPGAGVIEFPYSADFKIDTVEHLTVPAGSFEVLRLSGTITISDQTISQLFYLGKDIGVVKSVSDNLEGVKDTLELVFTNAGAHDLAVTKITAPKRVTLTPKKPSQIAMVKVQIQNRSPHPETIQDLDMLRNLATLTVESLGNCVTPIPLLRPPSEKSFPMILAPKKSLTVSFDILFDCANDPMMSTTRDPNHSDFRYKARVNHTALDGKSDTDPFDDVCPRNVSSPFVIDPNPDGTIKDNGCGEKKPDGTYGAEIVTDVVLK